MKVDLSNVLISIAPGSLAPPHMLLMLRLA
jgi:hypothetical protein